MSRNLIPEIKITNLDSKTRTIEFELTNSSTAFANALRRIMIAEVPTFAFEHIEVNQNTSSLPDEFIAHRLGLIPLVSETMGEMKYSEECTCTDGCPKCTVIYFIDVKCEGNVRIVTTDDLQYYEDTSQDAAVIQTYLDSAKTIKPVELPAIPGGQTVPITICKLGPGQVLQVLCKAVKGIGRTHAKWSPCSCAAYRMDPRVSVDQQWFAEQTKKKGKDYIQKFVESCPNSVFKMAPFEEEPVAIDPTDCTFCRQCQEYLEMNGVKDPEGKVIIDQVPDKFIFKVESNGSLRPETIVNRAFEVLSEKLTNLVKHIEQSETPLQ